MGRAKKGHQRGMMGGVGVVGSGCGRGDDRRTRGCVEEPSMEGEGEGEGRIEAHDNLIFGTDTGKH